MSGTPVWLCSISRRSTLVRDKPIATGLWSERTIDESTALLRRLLGPVGNPERERLFRMNITLCLHRALTDEEVAALPAYFHQDPAVDLAGGPVEILWESEPGLPSTMPCHRPRRQRLDPRDPLLWLPLDCGACPPCQARAKLDADTDRKVAALQARMLIDGDGGSNGR